MTKCKAYPHEKLNTSKGVIESKKLFLATAEEIRAALEKQGVADYKRIRIKIGIEEIKADSDYQSTPNSKGSKNQVLCLDG